MKDRFVFILILVLFLSGSSFAQSPAPTPPTDYRSTPHYQDALRRWKANPFRSGTEAQFEMAYERVYDVTPIHPNTALENISEAFESFNRTFKYGMGLDPDKPYSEQFEMRTIEVAIPIDGYAKLNRNQDQIDLWHVFLFTGRIQHAAAGIVPAHERAQVAIDHCDEELLAQSLREIDFIISEYEAVKKRAQEQIDQNDHQVWYYRQRIDFLDPEIFNSEFREPFNTSAPSIVDFLKLDVSMSTLYKDPKERARVVKIIEGEIAFIDKWSNRICDVYKYVEANIPKLRENKTRIRRAYDAKKCNSCDKMTNKPR